MEKFKFLWYLLLSGFILGACSECQVASYNQGINVIPTPKVLTVGEGKFKLSASTQVNIIGEAAIVADYFMAKINQSTGFVLAKGQASSNVIELVVDPALEMGAEAYTLEVASDKVIAKAKTPQGVFYAMQTVMQLLPAEIESSVVVENVAWTIPVVKIEDEPRFKYRGMHLDVCRHFNDIEFIKKQLDVLAMFKINRFHWHLTEDQLWTIEIKKYPKLTTIGSKRLEGEGHYHEGFYTQEQVKEVVKYAGERFIDVIPEIELPGHGLAALTGYPEYSCTGGPFQIRNVWGVEADVFCAGKESTFEFLENIISEVAPLFPSEYFHIGGDECPKTEWEKCPLCQKRMRQEGLKTEYELQSYFVQRIEKHVNSLGKKLIGWDEILEGGIAPSATIMSWQGEKGGIEAANAGHDVIMTPGNWMYLDHYQGAAEVEPVAIGGYTTLEETYSYNPIPKAIAADKVHHVIGAQCNIWTEYMYTSDLVEYFIFPRVIAVAELTWSPLDAKNYKDFERRIDNALVRLDGHHINYHIPLPEGPLSDYVAYTDSTILKFKNTRNYPMVYTVDGSEPTAKSTQYANPLSFDADAVVKIATLLPSGKMSKVRTLTVKKEELSAAFTGETKAGVKMSKLDGHFLNAEAYAKANFVNPIVVEYFNSFSQTAYKKPHVEMYEGYFELPEDGVYTIASDNEELWIDGVRVIDNNNKTKRHLRTKSTKALAKGKHSFKLVMNNSVYGGWPNCWSANTFHYKAPSSDKFTKVNASQLSH